MSELIEIVCPMCGARNRFPKDLCGTTQSCSNCEITLRVPSQLIENASMDDIRRIREARKAAKELAEQQAQQQQQSQAAQQAQVPLARNPFDSEPPIKLESVTGPVEYSPNELQILQNALTTPESIQRGEAKAAPPELVLTVEEFEDPRIIRAPQVYALSKENRQRLRTAFDDQPFSSGRVGTNRRGFPPNNLQHAKSRWLSVDFRDDLLLFADNSANAQGLEGIAVSENFIFFATTGYAGFHSLQDLDGVEIWLDNGQPAGLDLSFPYGKMRLKLANLASELANIQAALGKAIEVFRTIQRPAVEYGPIPELLKQHFEADGVTSFRWDQAIDPEVIFRLLAKLPVLKPRDMLAFAVNGQWRKAAVGLFFSCENLVCLMAGNSIEVIPYWHLQRVTVAKVGVDRSALVFQCVNGRVVRFPLSTGVNPQQFMPLFESILRIGLRP